MHNKYKHLLWRDALVCSLGAVLLTGILYILFINIHIFDPFHKAFEDFSFTDIYSSRIKNDSKTREIVLVNIKDAERSKIAAAINTIGTNAPAAIGIDAIFKDERGASGDSILKNSLAKYQDRIICAFRIDSGQIIQNHKLFRQIKIDQGFININSGQKSAVVRDFVGTIKHSDTIYTSFAYALAKKAKLTNGQTAENLTKPLKINYTGRQDSFLTFDIEEIISQKEIPAIRNAVVILGYMGNPTGNPWDIEDKHFTPMNPSFAGKTAPDMYGIVIHANIIKMISDNYFIRQTPRPLVYLFAFITCFFVTAMGLQFHKKSPFFFHLTLKLLELVVTVLLLYFTILLLNFNIHIHIEPIIILTLVGLEMVILYDHLQHYLKKQFQWESFLSH